MQGFDKMLKAMGIDVPTIKAQAEAFAVDLRTTFGRMQERIDELEARVRALEEHLDLHSIDTRDAESIGGAAQAAVTDQTHGQETG